VEHEDISDKELSDIVKKRQQDLENYRRNRGQATPLKDSLVGIATHRKRKNKEHKKNKWEGPDKDYTKIPHEFTEAMSKQYLRPNESKVLWFLIRKTWGWRKESDFIVLKQFSQELGISKEEASRALSSLRKRKIVEQLRNKKYAIQSNISLWHDRPKKKKAKKAKKAKSG